MKSIGFAVDTRTRWTKLATADIVPKAIRIEALCDEYPERFMQPFLNRVSQLGHLEKLKLFLRCDGFPVPAHAEKELIRAVRKNKNLKHLAFMACAHQWGSCMDDLFRALEKHKEMRTFRMRSYPDHFDPDYTFIKRLLTRNRYLEVTDQFALMEWDVYDICDLNRFFRGSKSLKNEPKAIRSWIVGEALIDDESLFQRTALLLADHFDIFCELLQEDAPTGEANDITVQADLEDGDISLVAASVASVKSSKGQKRTRKTDL